MLRDLIGLTESCVPAAYLQDERVEQDGGGKVTQQREEWVETITKTKEHMGWQDWKLGRFDSCGLGPWL